MLGHYLFYLQDESVLQKAGVLWYGLGDENDAKEAFIYDLVISPAFRRRGYASQAIAAVESHARQSGMQRVSLNVFWHNSDAQSLYVKMEFSPEQITMTKNI